MKFLKYSFKTTTKITGLSVIQDGYMTKLKLTQEI